MCEACHGRDGAGFPAEGVPIIAATPSAHLEEAIYAYQDGARRCVAQLPMCEIVSRLAENDVIELAEHFAGLERVWAGERRIPALAEKGERLHTDHCAQCHLRPDDPEAEYALGIPLHGQRSTYLGLAFGAYLSGARETLVPAMAVKLALLDADDIEALINYYASFSP